ncbi:MAG: mechanosensitive ion channel family protein [Candidatus Omnitrophota bacterium]
MHRVLFCLSGFLFLMSTASAGETAVPLAAAAQEHLGAVQEIIHMIMMYVVKYAFQVLGGCVVLALGWFMAQYAARGAQKYFDDRHVDITVSKFIAGAIRLLIMLFALVVALSKFGIEIAPFIAGISVVGFGTSFALQGPLSNYASGAALIFTKPFKIGEIIEVSGVVGEVMDMKLSCTVISTLDNETVVIPNKHIIGEIIHNYSNCKRVDIKILVSYRADLDRAIRILEDVIRTNPHVAADKLPKVGVADFTDLGINIFARLWCPQRCYWDVRFDINRRLIAAFKLEGIEVPVLQRNIKDA